jgi:uncharacterized membrane protein
VIVTTALTRAQRRAWHTGRVAWLLLIALCVLWEWRLAPLRPGGSWMLLKAAPLLLPIAGVWRGAPSAMQWALLLVLLYFCEGVVRCFDAVTPVALPLAEVALAAIFYFCAIVFLRPFKRAARSQRVQTDESA